jgi:uncharacterized protein YecT (DUF1311 family)
LFLPAREGDCDSRYDSRRQSFATMDAAMFARSLIAVLLVCALLMAYGQPAAAEDDLPPVDCSAPQSTYAINVCGEQELDKADASLNAVYKQVLTFIAKNGGEKPYDSKSWEEALRASQRAWVAFRDAHCKGLIPMSWMGGSGTSGEVLGCMNAMTKERTKELQSLYALE